MVSAGDRCQAILLIDGPADFAVTAANLERSIAYRIKSDGALVGLWSNHWFESIQPKCAHHLNLRSSDRKSL